MTFFIDVFSIKNEDPITYPKTLTLNVFLNETECLNKESN